jgi:hypothetical protein
MERSSENPQEGEQTDKEEDNNSKVKENSLGQFGGRCAPEHL